MLSVPQTRKRYPLPTGKEQALALAAAEKLFIHSAGAHIGNPSPSPRAALPAVLAAAQGVGVRTRAKGGEARAGGAAAR